MLLVSAQAVTAITSERDIGALDLLLVTDITPQEFIFGKLWGILYNTKEFLLPPLLLGVVYAAYSLLATPPRAHPELAPSLNFEALICIDMGICVVLGFAAVLGIHVALRNANSQVAVLNTLGTIFFLSAGRSLHLVDFDQWPIQPRFSFVFSWRPESAGSVGAQRRPALGRFDASKLALSGPFHAITNILVARPEPRSRAICCRPFVMGGPSARHRRHAGASPERIRCGLGRTTAAQE